MGLILEMIFGLTGLSGLAGLILLREHFGNFVGIKNVFDNYHCREIGGQSIEYNVMI